MPQCCDVARFFGTYVGGDDEIEKVHTDCWRQLIDKPSATVGRASSKGVRACDRPRANRPELPMCLKVVESCGSMSTSHLPEVSERALDQSKGIPVW